jgi:threonine aldolase
MDVINMRSDTQTLPTEEMLEAIRRAPLGDDTYDEDPTVARLEAMAAEKMGKEAALLCISGNMANLVALMTHARPGDEVIIDPDSHIYYYEVGGLASVAGLMPMPVPSHRGMLAPDEVEAAIRRPNLHHPAPRLLCLENTHNRAGGRVVPLDLHRRLCAVARKHGLAVYLDGARIFNAAIAAGLDAREYTKDVDSVMFCLSKGLSCPLGSVLCGTREFIERADRSRKRIGGGMRQAGIIAACGIVALEKMIDRLAEDHANAKLLAAGINEIRGLKVGVEAVETNMVYVDHTGTGLSTDDMLGALKGAGVLASARPPREIRLVTHRHHDRATVEEALRRIARAVAAAKKTR